jgi:hypothetical protein
MTRGALDMSQHLKKGFSSHILFDLDASNNNIA